MVQLKKKFALLKAGIKVKWILPFLNKEHTIFDIGAGNGAVDYILQQHGFKITASDKKNKSIFKEIESIEADGAALPMDDNAFDTVLLLTVLHHTKDPVAMLKEAIRITDNKIVVIEDVYKNPLQKYLTFITDSIVNLEFKGHPHSNKKEYEWEELFDLLELKIIHKESRPFLIWFRQVLYVLDKIKKG